MKFLLPLFVSLLCGCANIVLRSSLSSERITEVYQPTSAQAEFVHDRSQHCCVHRFLFVGQARIENNKESQA